MPCSRVYGGLLKTAATQQEIVEVLRRPRIAPKIAPAFLAHLETIFVAAEFVTIAERLRECRDPKDDKFLELAINGRADVIVSGDVDLLVLNAYRDISIITPATFARTIL